MSRTPKKTNRKTPAKTAPKAPAKTAPRPAPRKAKTAISSDWATGVVFSEKEPKLAVSLRLDADVLRFFRDLGSGYQTRINEVLRVFMDAHRGDGKPGRGKKR